MNELTHTDTAGRVRMVDVTDKNETDRTAVAAGEIRMRPDTFSALMAGEVTKGNVLETARIAGVMAAKRTGDLIPMCHPLMLTHVSVDFFLEKADSRIRIQATARLRGRTGVEMEALTAVSAAALTIYDMLKAIDKDMEIGRIRLMAKDGGKSGAYRRIEAPAE